MTLDIGLGSAFIVFVEAPEDGDAMPQRESHVEICNGSTCGLQDRRDYSVPSRSSGELGLEVTPLGGPISPCCPERCPSWLVAGLSSPQRSHGNIAMVFWMPCQLQPCRSVNSV